MIKFSFVCLLLCVLSAWAGIQPPNHCTKNGGALVNGCANAVCGQEKPSCYMGCQCDEGFMYDPVVNDCVLAANCSKKVTKRHAGYNPINPIHKIIESYVR